LSRNSCTIGRKSGEDGKSVPRSFASCISEPLWTGRDDPRPDERLGWEVVLGLHQYIRERDHRDDIVKFKDGLYPDESGARYRIVELNGDRAILAFICDLPIPPQSVARVDQLKVLVQSEQPCRFWQRVTKPGISVKRGGDAGSGFGLRDMLGKAGKPCIPP